MKNLKFYTDDNGNFIASVCGQIVFLLTADEVAM